MNCCKKCCPYGPPTSWTETGTLRVRTYAARDALPVPNATITVQLLQNGVVAQEKTFTTNAEGVSEDITLACPPRALSMEEDNTAQPYGTYHLQATATDFFNYTIDGLQIFAGERTLAELALDPVEATDTVSEANPNFTATARTGKNITTPPHALFIGNGGSGRGPLETPVLSSVVIPEKITVHLGRPAASAQNVTVNFRDYIKNVASSEVYPTWPREALLANIHAQISLALNRVYTEWYPSRGYNFNITNSTSYDQYFVYGREIFDVMSRLTDEIFNTYLRKTGNAEPFYAEYCDGKSVSCPGMKQWGTVTQAQQGKNALEILRYYYGNNIEIVRTTNIAAIPQSYPGTPLRRGDTGTNVRIMQRWLIRVAKDYPFFGTVQENGTFDAATESAIRKFQQQFSLTADGVVGRSTWYKLSYIYVSVKDLAELTSEGEKPTGAPVEGTYPGTALRLGSTGDAVLQIQFWLNTVGKYKPAIPALSVDGSFGPATQDAVRAFQGAYGLGVDGVVGAATWAELYRQYNSVQEDVGTVGGTFPGTTLRQGSTGDDVRRVQFWLRLISRNNTAVPDVAIDGSFGTNTAAAVRAFQSAYGLTSDGAVGKTTWNKLVEVYTGLINSLLTASERPGTYPGTVLAQGSTGRTVREMQYYLYILSAYYPQIPAIAFDGSFGPATATAVRAFQTLFGLTVDGRVGPATWAALYGQFTKTREVDGLVSAQRTVAYPGTELVAGASGDEVSFAQTMLRVLGQYLEPILPLQLTGTLDDETAASIKSFQALAGLPQTGTLNETTWESLTLTYLSMLAADGEAPQDEYPGTVMLLGSAGDDVRRFQQILSVVAARRGTNIFVPEDGIFENNTDAAVRLLQTQLSLPVTGTVDYATWQAIYNLYLQEE